MSRQYRDEGEAAAREGKPARVCPYNFDAAGVDQREYDASWAHKRDQWFSGWSFAHQKSEPQIHGIARENNSGS